MINYIIIDIDNTYIQQNGWRESNLAEVLHGWLSGKSLENGRMCVFNWNPNDDYTRITMADTRDTCSHFETITIAKNAARFGGDCAIHLSGLQLLRKFKQFAILEVPIFSIRLSKKRGLIGLFEIWK